VGGDLASSIQGDSRAEQPRPGWQGRAVQRPARPWSSTNTPCRQPRTRAIRLTWS